MPTTREIGLTSAGTQPTEMAGVTIVAALAASDEASYITGAELYVDGGYLAN